MALKTHEIPFLWTCNPSTHPNRFATTAILFGMHPTPVTHCRVLELGGGDGANLIPMAFNLPDSEFVGIGLDAAEVKRANEKITALKLKNIKISHTNLNDVTKEIGSFDYIIANGIYSWVTPEERASVLRIMRDALTPNGVAYVNYNAYPGWHMQSMLRDVLMYHIKGIDNQYEAVEKARLFLEFLANALPMDANPYGLFFKATWENTRDWDDSSFHHQFLNKINQPFYFHELIEAANKFDLSYLGEAEFHSMNPDNLPEPIRDAIQAFSTDIISIEQNMDFIRARPFRETLLCHREAEINRKIDVSSIRQFLFSASVKPIADISKIKSDEKVEFTTYEGGKFTLSHPAIKSLMYFFSQHWPEPASISTMLAATHRYLDLPFNLANDNTAPSATSKAIVDMLWFYYQKGLLKTYMHVMPMTMQISEFPQVSALTRFDALHQPWVANQVHDPVPITAFRRRLLPLLDGKHDIDKLVTELAEPKDRIQNELHELCKMAVLVS